MQGLIGLLDGKKRYLLLIVFLAEAVAGLAGHGNIADSIKLLVGMLGWDPSTAVVSAGVMTQFAASAWAVWDGIQKDRAKRRDAASTVSLPRS